jgi:hypothetical protein
MSKGEVNIESCDNRQQFRPDGTGCMTIVTQENRFPAALVKMLATGRTQGRTRELPLVGASTLNNICTIANNLCTIANIIQAIKAKRTLEVRMACGVSTLVFTPMHRQIGGDGLRGYHIAIDPFQDQLDDFGFAQIEAEGQDT